ncbi:MAG TPA: YafY family protein [Chloroflexota bacterium]|jgi:predicted DNA-binding transcriptional regulator YafY|nr:YafY family protein [Chloroflexota bacterium]
MATTSQRILRLLSLLQTHRYWPGAELADRLEVSPRTLRRDVERLRELGYPVEAHRGVDGGYQLAAGAALPPLVLDDEEAVALAIGLRAAAQGAIAGIEESSVRALAKVVQVMPPRLRRRVDALSSVTVPAVWGGGPSVDPGLLTTVAQACRDTERLRFVYVSQVGEETSRHVEPHWLVSLGRRWYLVAYDLHRADWRTFRLDRLNRPQSTLLRFTPRELPAKDPSAFVRASIQTLHTPFAVEVVVFVSAEVARRSLGQWATVEPLDAEDRCVLRMTVDNLDWAALALGSLHADFQVVSPPEMLDLVREWGTRFSRATKGVNAGPAQPSTLRQAQDSG